MVVKSGTKKTFHKKNTKNYKNSYKETSNKKIIENRPPKSGHSDAKYNFETFRNKKMKLKNYHLKFQKVKNRYEEPSNHKFIKNIPAQSRHSDSKYNFEIFKNKNVNLKKTP